MNKHNLLSTEPDWIREARESKEAARTQSETDRERRLAASMKIGANAPKFWRQLVSELETAAPHLVSLGANGSAALLRADSSSCAPPSQEHCHVQLQLRGLGSRLDLPRITNMNLYYTPGDCQIECYPLEGDAFTLDLVLDSKSNVAVAATDGCWNAQQTSEYLLRLLMERIGL